MKAAELLMVVDVTGARWCWHGNLWEHHQPVALRLGPKARALPVLKRRGRIGPDRRRNGEYERGAAEEKHHPGCLRWRLEWKARYQRIKMSTVFTQSMNPESDCKLSGVLMSGLMWRVHRDAVVVVPERVQSCWHGLGLPLTDLRLRQRSDLRERWFSCEPNQGWFEGFFLKQGIWKMNDKYLLLSLYP